MSYTMASGKGMVLDARKWGHHSLALFSLLCHHWTYETASVGLQATSVQSSGHLSSAPSEILCFF